VFACTSAHDDSQGPVQAANRRREAPQQLRRVIGLVTASVARVSFPRELLGGRVPVELGVVGRLGLLLSYYSGSGPRLAIAIATAIVAAAAATVAVA
jgi:hypothetical protein